MAEQPPRNRSRARGAEPSEPARPPAPRAHRKVREAATPPAPATSPAPRRRKRAAPEPATAGVNAPVEDMPSALEGVAAEPHAAAEASATEPGRRGREHSGETRSNALGVLIEQRFADAASPVRSYSDLERRSGVSREALSRYVTARADRRRSPTIDTLAAIADALRISLEQICRAAVAGAHGEHLPDAIEQRAREEVLMPLAGALSDAQFDALVELLRQIRRPTAAG